MELFWPVSAMRAGPRGNQKGASGVVNEDGWERRPRLRKHIRILSRYGVLAIMRHNFNLTFSFINTNTICRSNEPPHRRNDPQIPSGVFGGCDLSTKKSSACAFPIKLSRVVPGHTLGNWTFTIGRGLPGSLKGGSEITGNYQEIPMEVEIPGNMGKRCRAGLRRD